MPSPMTLFKYWLMVTCLLDNGHMTDSVGQFGLTFASIAVFKMGKSEGHVKRRFVTGTDLSSSDDKFHWLLLWISNNGQNFTTIPANHYCNNTESFSYHPSKDKTEFKYSGYDIYVRINHCFPLDDVPGIPKYSTLVLNIIGMNMGMLVKMMDDAKVYTSNTSVELQPAQNALSYGLIRTPVESQTVTSVILDEGIFNSILQDMRHFTVRQSWYIENGVPYRRGYLLFGPPGCGKTSAIMSLAGEINYNYFTYDLNDLQMSDERFIKSTEAISSKSVLLLKNVDATHAADRKDNQYDGNRAVGKPKGRFRDLVNVMNNLNSCDGLLVFMTANRVDGLDPELLKDGRIDFKQYIGPCTDYQLSEFFTEFRPGVTDRITKSFVKNVKKQNKPVIPADLKHFLLTNRRKNLKYVFEHITDIWKDEKNKTV